MDEEEGDIPRMGRSVVDGFVYTKVRGHGIEKYIERTARRPDWQEVVDGRAKDKTQQIV